MYLGTYDGGSCLTSGDRSIGGIGGGFAMYGLHEILNKNATFRIFTRWGYC